MNMKFHVLNLLCSSPTGSTEAARRVGPHASYVIAHLFCVHAAHMGFIIILYIYYCTLQLYMNCCVSCCNLSILVYILAII